VPRVALPPTVPFISQTMVAAGDMQNAAVNVCESASAALADEGETEVALEQVTVTLALANLELSATLAAVMTVGVVAGGTAGAV
jgi:hypothetical protein